MKSKEEILAIIDEVYKKDVEDTNLLTKQSAKDCLEECEGDYDTARAAALSMVMIGNMAYELLTKIQTAIDREDLTK